MSDTNSAHTVLLLHMEGDNNSTTFIDNGIFKKTITSVGATKISTAQSKWGNGSAYFNGNGDYLSVPTDYLNFGSSDFTIECHIYISGWASNNSGYYSSGICMKDVYGAREFSFMLNGTSNSFTAIAFTGFSNNSSYVSISGAFNFSLNTWYHIAAVRYGNNIYLYVNGNVVNSTTSFTLTLQQTTTLISIGGFNYGYGGYYYYLNGYIQDLRIKRFAFYTANFTPPAARLPDPDLLSSLIPFSGYQADLYDSGNYRICGTVTELGVAGQYRVCLFDRYSKRMIRETWSATDGTYAFTNIAYRPNGYFAVAYDYGNNPLNAAIADLITPELMP